MRIVRQKTSDSLPQSKITKISAKKVKESRIKVLGIKRKSHTTSRFTQAVVGRALDKFKISNPKTRASIHRIMQRMSNRTLSLNDYMAFEMQIQNYLGRRTQAFLETVQKIHTLNEGRTNQSISKKQIDNLTKEFPKN